MKNRVFIYILALFISSCGDVADPTMDKIEYDQTKPPVVVSNSDLTDVLLSVGANFNWDVDISAYNGISKIELNDVVVHDYVGGQLVHSGITITMPDIESYPVTLKVTDEIGLIDTESFTITKTVKPIITVDEDAEPLPKKLRVDAKFEWAVTINSVEGIAKIELNDVLYKEFTDDMPFEHKGVTITMLDIDPYVFTLKVTDKKGNVTSTEEYSIAKDASEPLPTYYIAKFNAEGVNVPLKDNPTRPVFIDPAYAGNCGWFKTTVQSGFEGDLTDKSLMYGSPSMNTARNLKMWSYVPSFNYKQSNDFDNCLMIRHKFTDAEKLTMGTNNKVTPVFFMNKLVLEDVIPKEIIADVVGLDVSNGTTKSDKLRVFKLDIYVDTQTTADEKESTFNLSKHSLMVINLANLDKFVNVSDVNNKKGQDHGMDANISKVNDWETLTFELTTSKNAFTPNAGDVEIDEVNILTLIVAAQMGTGLEPSNARYFLRNLRVEDITK